MKQTVRFRLNGRPTSVEVEGDRNLLWVLRTDLELTGTKYGCGESVCGACTVVVDGLPVRSCQYPVRDLEGKDLLTIEGLASGDNLHPIQEEFAERGALQCGYCTPGMIMNAYGLLQEKPNPSRAEILSGMDDNLCRCSAYKRIVEAVEAASERM